jgi:cysteine desulfurase
MYVNNEIGVIQDIPKIGKLAREKGIVFFCDATQAVGKIPVDVLKDQIDMLCFSGHKMNGPKGIGALYLRNGIKLNPLIHGGGQENGLRAGTYNTPLIVGLGEASRIAKEEFEESVKKLEILRSEIENYFVSNNLGTINFKNIKVTPHILSVTLSNQDEDDFLIEKNNEFVASTSSACNSSVIEKSHVLKAINMNKEIIRISI